MQDDLRLHRLSDIDLKNKHNAREIFETFDRFFFTFGRFPGINDLKVLATGDVSSFVQSSNVISRSELYKRYNLSDTRGLVCVHF